jgi:WD40 repeat protein
VRQLITVLTAVVVIAAAGFVLRNIAARQRDLAFSGMVATRATQLSVNDPSRGMQLSAAAYGIADSTEARSSLLSASTLHSATRVFADIGFINTVAISGHILASGSGDQTVRLYDISNPTVPAFLSSVTSHADLVNSVAFSPDGHTLASGSSDRTVRLWDTSNPRHPRLTASCDTNIGHRQGVTAVAFSSNGTTLAIGGADGTVQLWDLTHPDHPLTTLPGRAAFVNAVTFSPTSENTLISGNDDGTVRLWDLNHPHNPPRILTDAAHPTDLIETVAVSPNGHTLASGTLNGIVQLWDLTNPHQDTPFLTTLPGRTVSGTNKSVVFSPDGRTLAIGDTSNNEGKVWLWDLANLSKTAPADLPLIPVPLGGGVSSIDTVAFSADGHTLATGGSSTSPNGPMGPISLADTTDSHHPSSLTPLWHNLINSVYAVAFSPDGHTLASGIDTISDSGTSPGMVFLWDVDHPGNSLVSLPAGAAAVEAVAFSPSDGHVVANGDDDGTVRLWDLTHPDNPIATLPGGAGAVYTVAFSPDGHTLASGDADGTLRLWDLTHSAQPKPLDTLTGNTSWVNAVAFSPHGQLLASGGVDGIMRLWDVSNPHRIVPLPPLAKDVTYSHTVTFSPDGTTLVSGNNDGTLSLWDLIDPHHPIRAATPTLPGHDQMVRAIAFSPDGHLLATGSEDHTVRLWDFTDHSHPTPWAILTGHTNKVRAVAFNPSSDGHTLISGSEDGTVRLWETNPDKTVQDICSLTTTTRITDDQWNNTSPIYPTSPVARESIILQR